MAEIFNFLNFGKNKTGYKIEDFGDLFKEYAIKPNRT